MALQTPVLVGSRMASVLRWKRTLVSHGIGVVRLYVAVAGLVFGSEVDASSTVSMPGNGTGRVSSGLVSNRYFFCSLEELTAGGNPILGVSY